jgi:seryl-tRNA synthetase
MRETMKALFDEHRAPQFASKRDVHDALKPILGLAAKVNKQLAVYREHHLSAKLDEHDHSFDGQQEYIAQAITAAERATSTMIAAGEQLADVMTDLERKMLEKERDILALETSRANPPAADAPTVTLTAAEHAHLVARAAAGDALAVGAARRA